MIPSSFSINYEGNPLEGVFSYINRQPVNIKDKISIYSPTPYNYSTFCYMDKKSGDLYYLIDGDNESVWANENDYESNFTIDFKDSNFLVKSYTLQWPCKKPKNWNVTGSNDNTTWYLIDKIENDYEFVEFSHKKCSYPGTYRFIKFSTSDPRLHLTDVDLFGIYNPRGMFCSLEKRRSNKMLNSLFYFISLLCS